MPRKKSSRKKPRSRVRLRRSSSRRMTSRRQHRSYRGNTTVTVNWSTISQNELTKLQEQLKDYKIDTLIVTEVESMKYAYVPGNDKNVLRASIEIKIENPKFKVLKMPSDGYKLDTVALPQSQFITYHFKRKIFAERNDNEKRILWNHESFPEILKHERGDVLVEMYAAMNENRIDNIDVVINEVRNRGMDTTAQNMERMKYK